MDHRQAEPGSLAHSLGREERLDGAPQRFGVHALAGVGHREAEIAAGRQVGVAAIDGHVAHIDADGAAIGHRVARIHHQVQQSQLDLVGVDNGHGRPGGGADDDIDAGSRRLPHQWAQALGQLAQVHFLDFEFLAAGEGQQALGEGGAAPCPLERPFDQPHRPLIIGDMPAQHFEIAQHGHQQVVEVVRHAAGELTDGFHLLCLDQQLFGLLALLHGEDGALMRVLERGGAFDDTLLEAFIDRHELLLESLARGNVGGDADHFRGFAGSIDNQAPVDLRPMGGAVGPQGAILDLVVVARLDGVVDRRLHAVAIPRINGGKQLGIAEQVAGGSAESCLAGRRRIERHGREVEFPGAEIAGQQGGSEPFLAFGQFQHTAAGIILALPRADGGLDDAGEGGGMKRALEKGDVAQQFQQARGLGVAFGAAPGM